MTIDDFFENLWRDYTDLTPQAERIHKALLREGENVINDHVAFRTFNLAPINLEELEPHFIELGYTRFAPYQFKEKKLSAWSYMPSSPEQPRIFISELITEQLSEASQHIINKLCQQIDSEKTKSPDIFWAGRLWNVPTWQEYQTLLAESEYAAWLSVIGLRANHFTISVNHLVNHPTLDELLALVEAEGIPINESGGRIKGKPEQLLLQASTVADRKTETFAEGDSHEITTCYYEFAKRYKDDLGDIYQGFVAANADKIFESTNIFNAT